MLTTLHDPARLPPPVRPCLFFIESNTTGSGMLALDKADELGFQPVLFVRDAARYKGVEQTRCVIVTCETNDLAQLGRFIREIQQSNPHPSAGITTTSEFYVEHVAALAAEFHFPSNPLEMIRACRNKARTRQVLAATGFPQPRFMIVEDGTAIAAAVEKVGLPCVIKPCDDTGSFGVTLCHSIEEAQQSAEALLSRSTNVRGQPILRAVLCEEYIDAPEFSVETCAWEGAIQCVGITQKRLTGLPYFVECGHIFPAHLSPAGQALIETTTLQALQMLGNSYGPIHTEVKLTARGCVIIEINPRLAGGMIPELVRQAYGIDLLKSQIQIACRQEPELRPTSHASAGIHFLTAPRAGTLVEIKNLDVVGQQQAVIQAVVTAAAGQHVKRPQSAYDRLGYVIVRADSYHQAVEQLRQIEQTLDVVVVPGAPGDEGT